MESPKAPLGDDYVVIDGKDEVYIYRTRVENVEEKFRQVYVSGIGKDALFKQESRGWFVRYEGSWEGIYVGKDRPTFAIGDEVEVIMRKRTTR